MPLPDRGVVRRSAVLAVCLFVAVLGLVPRVAHAQNRASAGIPIIVALSASGQPAAVALVAGHAIASRVNVTSAGPLVDTSSTKTSSNVTSDQISNLPTGARNFTDLALVTPTVTRDMGNLSIGGGISRDNRYFVDGLPAQTWSDGRLGVQYTVDSIESVQVQRSDYSAEYGRFTGGIVNIKTKSGADGYNGGVRFFLGNNSWGANNPVDEQRGIAPNGSSFNLQGAFGGPIVKDKLWFMGSFRNDSRTDERRLSDTQTPYDADASDWGGQAFFNYGLADTFRFKGFYSLNGGSETTTTTRDSINPGTLITPDYSLSTGSFGIDRSFGSNLLGNFYGSFWNTSTKNRGGLGTNFDQSPVIDLSSGALANYPLYDGRVPIDRGSTNFGANFTWGSSTFLGGKHQFKFGAEYFSGSQQQSAARASTGYQIFTDLQRDNQGHFVFDNQDRAIPIFRQFGTAIFATDNEDPRKFTTGTVGAYVQDSWKLNDNWSFNLGVRYDSYSWDLNGDSLGSKTTFSPRLSVTGHLPWDKGWDVNASYGRLNSQIFEQFHGGGLLFGEKSTLSVYTGQSGIGYNFAPGFNLNNYLPVGRVDESQIRQLDDSLAPFAYDYLSFSASHKWSNGGLQFGYLDRRLRSAVDTATGAPVAVGDGNNAIDFDSIRYLSTDALLANYKAFWTELRYQPFDKLHFGMNYTYQLDFTGNYEFDKKDPGTAYGDYPEILTELRHFPIRNLDFYRPNDFAIWAIYTLYQVNQFSLDLSSIFHAQSGTHYPYTVTLPLTPIQEARVEAAGRVQVPSSQLLYFDGQTGHRDSEKIWNLGFTARRQNIVKGVDLYAGVEFHNLLNGQAWESGGDTTIVPQGPNDADGLPTTFQLGPNHGEPTRASGVQDPRQLKITFGLRF